MYNMRLHFHCVYVCVRGCSLRAHFSELLRAFWRYSFRNRLCRHHFADHLATPSPPHFHLIFHRIKASTYRFSQEFDFGGAQWRWFSFSFSHFFVLPLFAKNSLNAISGFTKKDNKERKVMKLFESFVKTRKTCEKAEGQKIGLL